MCCLTEETFYEHIVFHTINVIQMFKFVSRIHRKQRLWVRELHKKLFDMADPHYFVASLHVFFVLSVKGTTPSKRNAGRKF